MSRSPVNPLAVAPTHSTPPTPAPESEWVDQRATDRATCARKPARSAGGVGSSIPPPASATTPRRNGNSWMPSRPTSRAAAGCSPPGPRSWKSSRASDIRRRPEPFPVRQLMNFENALPNRGFNASTARERRAHRSKSSISQHVPRFEGVSFHGHANVRKELPRRAVAVLSPRNSRHPAPVVREETELAARVAEGDPQARDHMVRANLRLVVNLARAYQGKGLDLEDLIAEGNLGLMRAVKGFDGARDVRFSTYASYWIKQSIRAALTRHGTSLRLPAYMVTMLAKWKRTAARLTEQLGRPAEREEIGAALGLSPKKQAMVAHALAVCALNPYHWGGDSSLEDTLADERNTAARRAVRGGQAWERIVQGLERLGARVRSHPHAVRSRSPQADDLARSRRTAGSDTRMGAAFGETVACGIVRVKRAEIATSSEIFMAGSLFQEIRILSGSAPKRVLGCF